MTTAPSLAGVYCRRAKGKVTYIYSPPSFILQVCTPSLILLLFHVYPLGEEIPSTLQSNIKMSDQPGKHSSIASRELPRVERAPAKP